MLETSIKAQNRNAASVESQRKLIAVLRQLPSAWATTPVDNKKAAYKASWQHHPLKQQQMVDEIKSGRCKAIGVLCGTLSGGLLFVDHDGASCEELIEKLSDGQSMPQTVSVTSGRSGHYQMIYQVPRQYWEVIATKKLKTGKVGSDGSFEQLELRWNGCQSVIAGAHPITGAYHWLLGSSPRECDVAEAPAWMIAQMLVDQRADTASIQQPSFIDIPLYHCLSLDSRGLIDHGAREDSRNDSGAKLARDLLGTAAYLDSVGQPYAGDPEAIFMGWCRQVRLDKDKPARQPESIWKSAQRSNPKPCLSPDKIDNCISAWEHKQKQGKPEQPQPVKSNNRHSRNSNEKTQQLTPDQLINRVSEIRKLNDGVKQWFAWSELIRASGYSKRELIELQIAVETRSIFEPCEGLNFIANTPDQFEYLVDSLIVLGVNILVYADSGIGKSLLLYDIGKAVATGSYWSGFKAAEGIVLIIQTDEPSVVTKRRLKRMGFHKTQAGRWYVEQNWQFGQLQQLEGWIVEYQPKLIMIDCLATSNRSARTDENELAYALVQNDLMKLADRYHCTIVTLHHENKIGQARGSTGLPAHVSEVWQLRNPDSQEVKKHQLTDLHRILVIKKSRTNFVGKHLLELEPESYQWLYKGELTHELTSPPEGQETARALILLFLKEQSQFTYYSPEAISQTIGKSEHTVRKECSKLFDQGVLDRNSESSTGEKGRPLSLYRYKHFLQKEVPPKQQRIKNQNPDPVSNSNFDPHSEKDTPPTRKDSASDLKEGEY